jgi:protein-S-isoprenylcysteine O-methyltransferase Ste14
MATGLAGPIGAVWVSVGIVWAVAAVWAKPARRIEPAGSRFGHMLLIAAAFFLLFSARTRIGPLAWRFVPESHGAEYAGLGVTIAGAAFAVWARLFLGGNWSSSVTIKEGHTLVRSGPYAVVRHPIYSGFLFAVTGTAIALGELRGLVALLVAFISWWLKSRIEERFLIERFGAEYEAYERQVKALIPFVL